MSSYLPAHEEVRAGGSGARALLSERNRAAVSRVAAGGCSELRRRRPRRARAGSADAGERERERERERELLTGASRPSCECVEIRARRARPLVVYLHGASCRGEDCSKILELGPGTLPRLLDDGELALEAIVISPLLCSRLPVVLPLLPRRTKRGTREHHRDLMRCCVRASTSRERERDRRRPRVGVGQDDGAVGGRHVPFAARVATFLGEIGDNFESHNRRLLDGVLRASADEDAVSDEEDCEGGAGRCGAEDEEVLDEDYDCAAEMTAAMTAAAVGGGGDDDASPRGGAPVSFRTSRWCLRVGRKWVYEALECSHRRVFWKVTGHVLSRVRWNDAIVSQIGCLKTYRRYESETKDESRPRGGGPRRSSFLPVSLSLSLASVAHERRSLRKKHGSRLLSGGASYHSGGTRRSRDGANSPLTNPPDDMDHEDEDEDSHFRELKREVGESTGVREARVRRVSLRFRAVSRLLQSALDRPNRKRLEFRETDFRVEGETHLSLPCARVRAFRLGLFVRRDRDRSRDSLSFPSGDNYEREKTTPANREPLSRRRPRRRRRRRPRRPRRGGLEISRDLSCRARFLKASPRRTRRWRSSRSARARARTSWSRSTAPRPRPRRAGPCARDDGSRSRAWIRNASTARDPPAAASAHLPRTRTRRAHETPSRVFVWKRERDARFLLRRSPFFMRDALF